MDGTRKCPKLAVCRSANLTVCGKHVRRKNRKDVVEGYRKDVDWWKSWKVLDKKERLVVRREKIMCAAIRILVCINFGRTSLGGYLKIQMQRSFPIGNSSESK